MSKSYLQKMNESNIDEFRLDRELPQPDPLLASQKRGWGEATLGGVAKGGLRTVSSMISAIKGGYAEATGGLYDPAYDELQQTIQGVIADHPEWGSRQVESALDLLTSLQALAGTLFESIPYMIGASISGAAGTAVGGPVGGVGAAMGFGALVEGGGAFNDTIMSGGSYSDAMKKAAIVGPISGMIEAIPFSHYIRVVRGGKGLIARRAMQKVAQQIDSPGFHFTKEWIWGAGKEALEETLQEVTSEVGDYIVEGKVEEGYMDRVLQSAIGGVAMGATFGGAAAIRGAQVSAKEQRAAEQAFTEATGGQFEGDPEATKAGGKAMRKAVAKAGIQKESGEEVREEGEEPLSERAKYNRKMEVFPEKLRAMAREEQGEGRQTVAGVYFNAAEAIEEFEGEVDWTDLDSIKQIPGVGDKVAQVLYKENEAFEEAAAAVPEIGREQFFEQFRAAYGQFHARQKKEMAQAADLEVEGRPVVEIDEDTFNERVRPLIEAYATAWASHRGLKPSDWYKLNVAEVKRQTQEGATKEGALGSKYGYTLWLADGRALMRAMEEANISTGIHELAHVWRRGLTRSQRKQVEGAIGIEGGQWTTQAEEYFATAFERYITGGGEQKVVPAGLRPSFESFKNWMRNIYGNVVPSKKDRKNLSSKELRRKYPLMDNVSQEMKNLFSNMFGEPDVLDTTKEGVQERRKEAREAAKQKKREPESEQRSDIDEINRMADQATNTETGSQSPLHIDTSKNVATGQNAIRQAQGQMRAQREWDKDELGEFKRVSVKVPRSSEVDEEAQSRHAAGLEKVAAIREHFEGRGHLVEEEASKSKDVQVLKIYRAPLLSFDASMEMNEAELTDFVVDQMAEVNFSTPQDFEKAFSKIMEEAKKRGSTQGAVMDVMSEMDFEGRRKPSYEREDWQKKKEGISQEDIEAQNAEREADRQRFEESSRHLEETDEEGPTGSGILFQRGNRNPNFDVFDNYEDAEEFMVGLQTDPDITNVTMDDTGDGYYYVSWAYQQEAPVDTRDLWELDAESFESTKFFEVPEDWGEAVLDRISKRFRDKTPGFHRQFIEDSSGFGQIFISYLGQDGKPILAMKVEQDNDMDWGVSMFARDKNKGIPMNTFIALGSFLREMDALRPTGEYTRDTATLLRRLQVLTRIKNKDPLPQHVEDEFGGRERMEKLVERMERKAGKPLFQRGTIEEAEQKFKNSKVRDADGNLLVVYHGTALKPGQEFGDFDPSMRGSLTGAPSAYDGFYFSKSPSATSPYMDLARRRLERSTGSPFLCVAEAVRELDRYSNTFYVEDIPLDLGKIKGLLERVQVVDDLGNPITDLKEYFSRMRTSNKPLDAPVAVVQLDGVESKTVTMEDLFSQWGSPDSSLNALSEMAHTQYRRDRFRVIRGIQGLLGSDKVFEISQDPQLYKDFHKDIRNLILDMGQPDYSIEEQISNVDTLLDRSDSLINPHALKSMLQDLKDALSSKLDTSVPKKTLIEAVLNLENVRVYDKKGRGYVPGWLSGNIREAKKLGYDGIIVKNFRDPMVMDQFVVFDTENIMVVGEEEIETEHQLNLLEDEMGQGRSVLYQHGPTPGNGPTMSSIGRAVRLGERLGGQLVDFSTRMKINTHGDRVPAASRLIEKMDDVASFMLTVQGKFEDKIHKGYGGLSGGDLNWLMRINDDGETNQRKMIEGDLRAPSQAIERWHKLMTGINEELGRIAEELPIYRQVEDEKIVPFVRSKKGKLLRAMNEAGYLAITRGSGPTYDAIMDAVKKLNPDMEVGSLTKAVKSFSGLPRIRHEGSLEDVRVLPRMPDAVKVDGKWVQIMYTDPLRLARSALRRQASRLGVAKFFGQGAISTLGTAKSGQLARILGKGEEIKWGREQVTEELEKLGYDRADLEAMDWNEMRKFAKKMEVPRGATKELILKAIDSVDADSLTEEQIGRLREWGKKVKGFDYDVKDVHELLRMAKERVHLEVPNHYKKLRNQYRVQGGDLAAFDDAFRILQGYPYISIRGKGRLARWTNFVSRIIGGMQISRAFIPNIPQTLALVPGYVGTARYMKAVMAYHTHREEVFKRATAAGAADRGTRLRSIEPGNVPEDLATRITDWMVRGSLLKHFTDKNNLIAAEAFRYMAEDWKQNGIHPEETDLAYKLRLTKKEIQAIKDGKMDDHTFNKIIQQGVAQTQFYTEASHRKGLVEINPYLRFLFPYQNYAVGTMKATMKTFREAYLAWKSGDTGRKLTTTRRLVSMLARYAGTGMIAAWLRDMLMPRDEPEEVEADEELWEMALEGLMEVQFLGPVMRTMDLWKGEYGGPGDLAMSFSPKVEALLKVINIGSAPVVKQIKGEGLFGKYRKFPVTFQAGKWVEQNYGEVNTFIRWLNKAAWPERDSYYDAASSVRHWKEKYTKKKIKTARTDEERQRYENELLDMRRYSNVPLNPDYDAVYQATVRGDVATSIEAARAYYRKMLRSGYTFQEAKQKLRSSLTQRSPINMKLPDTVRFLNSLSSDRKRKIYRTHTKYMGIVNAVAPTGG